MGRKRKHYSRERFYGALILQFYKAGLNTAYPFNINHDDYFYEVNKHTCYKNEKRIQWVRDQLKDL